MALEDYRDDMLGCSRCSACKWIPFNQVKSWRFARGCPSIERFSFQAYSGSGRMVIGLSTIEGRSTLNEDVTDIIYRCQMCGLCDTACKVYREDIDLMEVMLELRARCVEEGMLVIEHMVTMDALKMEGNMMGEPAAARGDWAAGLDLRDINLEGADVMFHAGCRSSFDPDLRETIRGAVRLIQATGAQVAIAGSAASCCGGRAYEIGYRGDAANFADDMLSRVKASRADLLVTACADCYAAFNYLYPLMGRELPCRVMHLTRFLAEALPGNALPLHREVPLTVTYHDPCHLGRMGEPFAGRWTGSKLERPARFKRMGRKGEYEAPRRLLGAIPGLRLVEMERIREYSWCCGAGGGVLEAYPDFAGWTAGERVEEAMSTGAGAIATSCPWCEHVLKAAVGRMGVPLQVFDVSDLVLMSAGILVPA